MSFLLDLYKHYYAAEVGNENNLAAYNVQNICHNITITQFFEY